MFLPPPATTEIHDAGAKHYATLRFALATRNIGSIMTANPSSLVEFARRANQDCESLVRDIHDGTLSCEIPPNIRQTLARSINKRRPRRARELSRLANAHGALLPKHVWPGLSMLAVWTGGSVGVFLPQLPELYGKIAIRDHGLSASEGRMTIPLTNSTSAGLLDFYHHYFEFIPIEEYGTPTPVVLEAHELERDRDYYILLTTSGGLYRYDIHDVVRCVGFRGEAPLLEFLNKAKNFSNLTGEKLSEYQVVRAVEKSFAELKLPADFFAVAPVMEAQPRYVLLVEPKYRSGRAAGLAARVQVNLELLNEEYAAKCAGGRILPVDIREVPAGTWHAIRRQKTGTRGNFEEYKHVYLVQDLTYVERLAGSNSASASPPATIPFPIGTTGSSTTQTPAAA